MSNEDLQQDTLTISLKCLRWCHSHFLLLLASAVVGLCILQVLTFYRSNFAKDIVVLTGAPGTTSDWYCDDFIAAIEQRTNVPGVSYTAHQQQLNGLDDVRNRIKADHEGRTVGFYVNCKNDHKSLNVVVPLDYEYLHILCRVGFLHDHNILPNSNGVYDFADIYPHLGHSSVFAGPYGSAARYMAEAIFSEQTSPKGRRFREYLQPAVQNWDEARPALKNGVIDVLFYLGGLNCRYVSHIAAEDSEAVLVGIKSIQISLTKLPEFSILKAWFPENAYIAGVIQHELPRHGDGAEAIAAEYFFCKAQLETVAVRRVLVCSAAMDARDAYQIAQAAKDALGTNQPEIGAWGAEAVPETVHASDSEKVLGLTPHPGGVLDMKGTEPAALWSVERLPPWLVSCVSSMLVVLCGALLHRLAGDGKKAVVKERPVGGEQQPADRSAVILLTQYGNRIRELESREDPMDRDEWESQKEHLQREHAKIVSLMKANQCTPNEGELLFAALRNMQDELDFFEPPMPKAGRRTHVTAHDH